MKDAPIPFITMMLPSSTGSLMEKQKRSRKNHIVISSMPRQTTVKPITEPAENATRRPLCRLSEAACAVLALELVATFMPIRPASIEKTPPVTKAKGVNIDNICPSEISTMASRRINTTMNTLNTVLHCCFK